jgi:PAS domain S-box-containing protein
MRRVPLPVVACGAALVLAGSATAAAAFDRVEALAVDGTAVLLVLVASAILIAAHRLRTGAVEARSRDLERQIREREEAQRALLQSERQLRLIADAVPVVIAYVDAESRVRFANRAVEEWTGRPPAELHGRPLEEVLPPAVLALVREQADRAQGGERVQFDLAVDVGSGARRRIAATLVPHRGADGAVLGFYAFAEDISDRVRDQEELHRQHDALAHAARLSTLGEMAAALAHELNQPLTAVLSNANAILRQHAAPRAGLPGEVEETVRDIAAEAARAGEIIRRLRALVRKGDSTRTTLDLNHALRGVEPFIRAVALESDVALFMDLSPEPLACEGDAIQLQQVVLNLVRNAIQAMAALPKPERRLVLRSRRERDLIVVSVEDSGPPVASEVLDGLFVPFYTTKANGLGMGLSISRSIVEAHGGVIEARSRGGRGLAVRFTLPLPGVQALSSAS